MVIGDYITDGASKDDENNGESLHKLLNNRSDCVTIYLNFIVIYN